LLCGKRPFDIWFGRKPHWIDAQNRQIQGLNSLDEDSDNEGYIEEDDELGSDEEDAVLTEIEKQVAQNNIRIQAQMVRHHNSRNQINEFTEGSIATLKIHPKHRVKTDSLRIPVRILEYEYGQYKLQSQHGRLVGRYQGLCNI
jgi:hypothetical protein